MRYIKQALLVLAALVALAAFAAAPGQAAEQKWCAQYGPGGDGGRNCGFATLEQCMLTVSGIGGFCQINMFYTGPQNYTDPEKQPVQRKKKHSS